VQPPPLLVYLKPLLMWQGTGTPSEAQAQRPGLEGSLLEAQAFLWLVLGGSPLGAQAIPWLGLDPALPRSQTGSDTLLCLQSYRPHLPLSRPPHPGADPRVPSQGCLRLSRSWGAPRTPLFQTTLLSSSKPLRLDLRPLPAGALVGLRIPWQGPPRPPRPPRPLRRLGLRIPSRGLPWHRRQRGLLIPWGA
jgi:hypothetical protein